MAVDRKTPTITDHPSDIDGETYADEINEEIEALWSYIGGLLNGVAGTNTITATAPVTITAYSDGMQVTLTPANNNTGNATLNVNGVGAKNILDQSGSPIPANTLVASRKQQLEFDSALDAWCMISGSGTGSGVQSKVTLFQNAQTNATAGGTATAGSWLVYALNTAVQNDLSGEGVTLTTNVIGPLPAGTYDVFATVPFHLTLASRLRLWNTTDSAVVATLASDTVRATTGNEVKSATLRGRFTIASAKSFRLEYRVGQTRATDGLGVAASFTETEKYGNIMIARPPEGNLGLGTIATHNITISPLDPSGGADGDIWMKVTP